MDEKSQTKSRAQAAKKESKGEVRYPREEEEEKTSERRIDWANVLRMYVRGRTNKREGERREKSGGREEKKIVI